ncbi:PilW family protein [Halochromatium sp.]
MLGMTVGMIVVAAVVAMLVSTLSLNARALNDSYLNQELKAIMDIMVRDIRRAQYSAASAASVGGSACAHEFVCGLEDWMVEDARIEYTYDENASGSQDNDECFGFRHRLSSGVGKVEKKYSCTPTWQSLSDANAVDIDDLRFSAGIACIPSGSAFLAIREVKIYLEGSHAGTTRWLCQKVRVKNDLPSATCAATAMATSAPFNRCPP